MTVTLNFWPESQECLECPAGNIVETDEPCTFVCREGHAAGSPDCLAARER